MNDKDALEIAQLRTRIIDLENNLDVVHDVLEVVISWSTDFGGHNQRRLLDRLDALRNG